MLFIKFLFCTFALYGGYVLNQHLNGPKMPLVWAIATFIIYSALFLRENSR